MRTHHSSFNQTQTYAILLWHDEDENGNPETEET